MSTDRFFLDSDDDGHWYLVPLDIKEEWIEWNNLGTDEPPEGVQELGSHPNVVSFLSPDIDYD